MGPLTATSSATFENLNRVLKQSVTGSRGQPHQMVSRFIRQQELSRHVTGINSVRPLGRLKDLTDEMNVDNTRHIFNDTVYGYVNRFAVHSLTFHSYKYGRSLKCASYYAFLASTNSFVKIKFIFVGAETIHCVCRDFEKKNLHRDPSVSFSFSDDMMRTLDTVPAYFVMKKGRVKCYPAKLFTNHAIVYKRDSNYYGVKVQNNFEHE